MIQLRSALASLDGAPSFSLCACLAVVLAVFPAHSIGAAEDGGGACDEASRGIDGACAGSSETTSKEELEDDLDIFVIVPTWKTASSVSPTSTTTARWSFGITRYPFLVRPLRN